MYRRIHLDADNDPLRIFEFLRSEHSPVWVMTPLPGISLHIGTLWCRKRSRRRATLGNTRMRQVTGCFWRRLLIVSASVSSRFSSASQRSSCSDVNCCRFEESAINAIVLCSTEWFWRPRNVDALCDSFVTFCNLSMPLNDDNEGSFTPSQELNWIELVHNCDLQFNSVQFVQCERVRHVLTQFAMAASNHDEVGRCDASLGHNLGPCIYRYIRFSLKNGKWKMQFWTSIFKWRMDLNQRNYTAAT